MRILNKVIFTINIIGFIVSATFILNLLFGARYALDLTAIKSNMTEIPSISFIPFYIFMMPTHIPLPIPITLNSLALLFLTIYVVLAGVSLIHKESILDIFKGRRINNDLLITMKIMSLILILIIVIEGIQEAAGIPTGELEAPNEYIRYVSALVAPLVEELGFRVSIIGFILLIIGVSIFRDEKPIIIRIIKILWTPLSISEANNTSLYRYFAYFLVLTTSIAFGLAHYLSGGGWDIGKVSTATIAGISLGYLYVKYGIHTAILGHAFFNVYLLSMYYIELYVGGILNILIETVFISVLILGIAYFIELTLETLIRINIIKG